MGMRWCSLSFPLCAFPEPQLQPGPLLATKAGCWQALQLGTSSGNIPKFPVGLGLVSGTAATSQRLVSCFILFSETYSFHARCPEFTRPLFCILLTMTGQSHSTTTPVSLVRYRSSRQGDRQLSLHPSENQK